MNKNVLWSLRLGFSSKEAAAIHELGMERFLELSFEHSYDEELPSFLRSIPQTYEEIRKERKMVNALPGEQKTKKRREERMLIRAMEAWWIQKMQRSPYPLRESMVCMWHNHFVAASQKVKIPYYLFQHHQLLQEHAFGNFRELTKAMVTSNAVIAYLDNQKNRINNLNENLARELLELFTLGIGNYTENDIKSAAKALSGLGVGDEKGRYRIRQHDTDVITFLGKTGRFQSDDIVHIIFEQASAPYRITEKILRWFLTDRPSEDQIKYYGDYLRDLDYEIKPLINKIVLETYEKSEVALKIKDPLRFALQTIHELNLNEEIKTNTIEKFLRDQGMQLFNPPNVKGWDGGNSWLTSTIYVDRCKAVDRLCAGLQPSGKTEKTMKSRAQRVPKIEIPQSLENNKEVIQYLVDRNLCHATGIIWNDLEEILKYDFKPHDPGSHLGIARAYNYIVNTPEYQVI